MRDWPIVNYSWWNKNWYGQGDVNLEIWLKWGSWKYQKVLGICIQKMPGFKIFWLNLCLVRIKFHDGTL